MTIERKFTGTDLAEVKERATTYIEDQIAKGFELVRVHATFGAESKTFDVTMRERRSA